jgi:hypothetical protein
MGHCYHHALSSVKKWGGIAEDYLPLHNWFDVMWTRKLFLLISLAEVVVPVVHRRGPPPSALRVSARSGAGGEVPADPPGRVPGGARWSIREKREGLR